MDRVAAGLDRRARRGAELEHICVVRQRQDIVGQPLQVQQQSASGGSVSAPRQPCLAAAWQQQPQQQPQRTIPGELDAGVNERVHVRGLNLRVALLAVPSRVSPAEIVDQQEQLEAEKQGVVIEILSASSSASSRAERVGAAGRSSAGRTMLGLVAASSAVATTTGTRSASAAAKSAIKALVCATPGKCREHPIDLDSWPTANSLSTVRSRIDRQGQGSSPYSIWSGSARPQFACHSLPF